MACKPCRVSAIAPSRYTGGNGPGVVVAKGDKLFTIEFSGIGDGPSEKSSLLLLATQAVARVH